MKCLCCGIELKEGKAICNICGLPTLAGDDNVRANVINETRHKYLDNVFVSVNTYNYQAENGRLSEKGSEYVRLGDAFELTMDKIQWLNMEFEEIESKKKFELELLIDKKGKKEYKTVTIVPSKNISHKKIGICLKAGFNCAIAVGNQDSFEMSEQFSLT